MTIKAVSAKGAPRTDVLVREHPYFTTNELVGIGLALVAAHALAVSYTYLLFHSLMELGSIAVAITVATIAINCRKTMSNQYVLVVGTSYVFIGFIDLMHTLSYRGMGIFTDYDYYAPQFWIAGRYLESVSMLGAFAFVGTHRRVPMPVLVGVYGAITVALVVSILHLKVFPVCFVAGEGLTAFKVISEYVICALLAGSLAILYAKRAHFDRRIYRLVQGSLALMIAMELCFTLYVSDAMSDAFNELGHIFKVGAFYLVYKAVVVTGLRDPINLVYRELKASEASLLEAQALAGLGRWEWELKSGHWTWTDEVFRILGLEPESAPSLEALATAVQEQDRPALHRGLHNAAETHAPFELLLHLGQDEGAIRFAQMRGEFVAGGHGEPARVIGTLQDVTINQFSVESAEDMVAWLTPTGHFAYVNRAASTLLGYSRDELLALRASDINRTQPPQAFVEQWQGLRKTGTLRFETMLTRKDGSTVPVEISENHVSYGGDEYNVMFVRDMTVHKEASAKITSLKDLYAALSHTNQAIINCPDRQSLFEAVVNIAVEYGHFRLSWIGLIDDESKDIRPVAVAGPGADYTIDLQVSAAPDSPWGQGPTGRCVRAQSYVVANDFAHSPITKPWQERQKRFGFRSAAAFPISNGGRVVGALTLYSETAGFFTPELIDLLTEMSADISSALDRLDLMAANAKHQEELRRAVEILELSNTELERFAFIASHDLQEPLRAITLFTQMLERRLGDTLTAEARDDFDMVVGAAKRMRLLIQDLLEYSRVNVKDTSFTQVALEHACRSAVENLEETVRACGGQITVEPLPTIVGDGIQLMQLFQNLIANGLKFHRPGEVPRIDIGAERQGDEWVVSVKDNGIGIEATDQDIFQIFRRLHAGDTYPGSGVGLAICRRIVERHNGRIWYESRPGEGATFRFTLPVAKPAT